VKRSFGQLPLHDIPQKQISFLTTLPKGAGRRNEAQCPTRPI